MVKIGVIFGGVSNEHSISIMSGCSIVKNLNKLKYEVLPIYIDREGNWYEVLDDIYQMPNYKLGEEPIKLKLIENVIKFLPKSETSLTAMLFVLIQYTKVVSIYIIATHTAINITLSFFSKSDKQ